MLCYYFYVLLFINDPKSFGTTNSHTLLLFVHLLTKLGVTLIALSTGICNQADLLKRENPFERRAEGQKKTRSSFLWVLIIPSAPLCLQKKKSTPSSSTSTALLSHRSNTPQTHAVSHKQAPPLFSHWLFYSLISTAADTPSFSLPPPFFFSRFLVARTEPAHNQRAPVSLHHWLSFKAKKQNKPLWKSEPLLQRKLLLKSKGTDTAFS